MSISSKIPKINGRVWTLHTKTNPPSPAWYPVLICWDAHEGFFPKSAYWNGTIFESKIPVTHFISKPFDSEDKADKYAWEHDPNW